MLGDSITKTDKSTIMNKVQGYENLEKTKQLTMNHHTKLFDNSFKVSFILLMSTQ